jgi:hypothetical protein
VTPGRVENVSDVRAFIGTHDYTEVMDANGVELWQRSNG